MTSTRWADMDKDMDEGDLDAMLRLWTHDSRQGNLTGDDSKNLPREAENTIFHGEEENMSLPGEENTNFTGEEQNTNLPEEKEINCLGRRREQTCPGSKTDRKSVV